MRILLIEDEHYAAKRLKNLITAEIPDVKILAVIDTVEEAVEWLSSHIEPHLIFMDIQLADGLSFQIFEKVQLNCPIIFTTAYDEYALSAFKVNSIDYLLKPIEETALRQAINKYQKFYPANSSNNFNWRNITKEIFHPQDHYKQRFLVKSGGGYSYLNVKDISLFFSEDGMSFAHNKEGKKILIDHSLDKIESTLDPNLFFRISRKHILSLSNIKQVHPYLNNRLKVEVKSNSEDGLVVSREKVKDFKNWLDS